MVDKGEMNHSEVTTTQETSRGIHSKLQSGGGLSLKVMYMRGDGVSVVESPV
jgi:hypothetical protein